MDPLTGRKNSMLDYQVKFEIWKSNTASAPFLKKNVREEEKKRRKILLSTGEVEASPWEPEFSNPRWC